MKFEEILPLLREGKKIRVKGWKEIEYIYKPENEDDIRAEDYKAVNLSWQNIFSDDWEIVEKKKKVKLRDLTEEQYREYDCEERICAECPFSKVECNLKYDNCWFKHKELYNDKFLDQEIELKEE